jgi:hypothetical protein
LGDRAIDRLSGIGDRAIDREIGLLVIGDRAIGL